MKWDSVEEKARRYVLFVDTKQPRAASNPPQLWGQKQPGRSKTKFVQDGSGCDDYSTS